IAELEQIVKEKNALETELKQIIEENAEKAKLRDAELNARIMELERSAKENEERFAKLEQKQNNNVGRLENGDNSSENDVNIPDLVIKSLEDDTPASDITDDALSSDVYQGSKIQCSISSIHTESKSPEDKEIVHKEWISNEIRERNREKKLRSQGLSSDNNSSEQSNSLYNVKTVTLETNLKNSTEVSGEETKPRGYDSSNLNIPEISSKSKLPTNLLLNQKIPYNQKVERAYENRVSDVKSVNNTDDQSARTIVYNEIKSLLPDVTDVNLRKITSRAKKVYIFYEGSSTDMISVTNCHAHVTEPSQENDQDESKTRSSASSELPEAEVNASTEDTESRVSDSANSETEEKRKHVIKMVLERFTNLSFKRSSKYTDHFNCTETCPVCNKEHKDDNEGISEWNPSGNCEKREYKRKAEGPYQQGIEAVSG
ncbi:11165_t:CDS:2, partial [Gigaspora rosea]